ncbi:MAG: type II toxin-antitoxin system VapC family toxin [Gemmatimonadetes bacterium]|nr:type II toxin-antitoxin system VapC family toxin [Gemmatimonadota bacterium]
MALLLDTHTFLWLIHDDPRLSPAAAAQIANPETRVFVSVVSAWEIVIKQRTGKIALRAPISEWWDRVVGRLGLEVLNVTSDDVLAVEPLPLHHRDPFDRLLIAQAIRHNLPLVSADTAISAYSVERIW